MGHPRSGFVPSKRVRALRYHPFRRQEKDSHARWSSMGTFVVRSKENGSCGCCLEPACAQTPRYPATLADVGPRSEDGQTQGLYGSYGCAGVLLRSAESLAARHDENTNLLLRQYFPRGTDLSGYSQVQLDQVARRLNQRPRKTLGFETPASKLQASVASTI